MSASVTLFRPNGEPFDYAPVSARIPKFLEAYPPAAFSVVTAVGPDPTGARDHLLFRAELRTADGRVVANAHSRGPIRDHKDLEALETAALQRLLARLGHGGNVLDHDERRDQTQQGLQQASERSAHTPRAAQEPVAITPEHVTASNAPATEAKNPSEAPADDETQAASNATPADDDPLATKRLEAMRRQLSAVARSRNVTIDLTEYTTLDAVRNAIREINRGGA